jgi:imidazolonepropionase-like amidohydrolase
MRSRILLLLAATLGLQAQDVLIKGATLLTVSHGTLAEADLLIEGGRIKALGKGLKAPANARVIEAQGRFVMPGIVDTHSHFAAEGNINEMGLAVTSMVGLGTILDPQDLSIYRRLADGVTTANLLHGSANPIGGTSVTIKLRWGVTAGKDLLVEGAPVGIKFALGENPKRSNFQAPGPARYPGSRLGVMDVIRQAFTEARAYQKAWKDYEARAKKDKEAPAPARDLKLEPLVEVLEGKRLVHAHSYRSDEILALLRLAEEFGFRIATLQHALEAYKVAPEIRKHGAAVGCFADHWGYKVEAVDAIPQNAALCLAQGISVSINSDYPVVPRLLNQEAARAQKYGGLTDDQTLALITLNPARQLGVGDRVGSLDVGKDGDVVIYDRHPLSIYAVPQVVLVEGRVRFDRAADLAGREALAAEKKALKEKLAKEAKPGGSDGPARPTGADFRGEHGTEQGCGDDHTEEEHR